MKKIRGAAKSLINKVDMFGSPLSLTYPHGRSVYRTCFGSFLTIAVGLITMMFLVHDLLAMIQYS